jgi:hypothetical protein
LNECLEIVCSSGLRILPNRIDSRHENLCVVTTCRVGEQGRGGAGLRSRYGVLELNARFFQKKKGGEAESSTPTCCNTEAGATLPDALVPYHFPLWNVPLPISSSSACECVSASALGESDRARSLDQLSLHKKPDPDAYCGNAMSMMCSRRARRRWIS